MVTLIQTNSKRARKETKKNKTLQVFAHGFIDKNINTEEICEQKSYSHPQAILLQELFRVLLELQRDAGSTLHGDATGVLGDGEGVVGTGLPDVPKVNV